MEARAYRITPADELVARGLATRGLAAAPQPSPDPAPSFGEVRGPVPGALLTAGPVLRYVFRGAVVHGPDGAVTVGRHAVHETVMLTNPPVPGTWHGGGLWMSLREYPLATLPEAEHLLCGAPGNYCHWLTEAVGRATLLPPGDSPALLPWSGAAFQAENAALYPEAAARSRHLAADESVAVARLGWTAGMTRMGGAYHPALLRLAAAARAAAGQAAGRDIYVSRRDSALRPLRNEPAVEALCTAHGYTPVTLTGMPVLKQVALFAGARRIVAPHGAGLANILFCRPGAKVLELFMDHYANACFRRLAACAGLRWGGLVGQTEPGGDPDWVHGTGWSVDLDRLAAILDDPAFAPEDHA